VDASTRAEGAGFVSLSPTTSTAKGALLSGGRISHDGSRNRHFAYLQLQYDVIPEIRAKIGALSRPRGMSCRPVLIHVNGVSEEVTDSDYFAHIVDMGGLLN
jgi:hypothetical protein